MEYASILELFLANAERNPEQVAAMEKRRGAYQDVTWAALERDVNAIAAGLVGLGVEAGDRVCLLSNTRLEWVTCDFGILGAGGVTVPIYASNLPDECQYICEDSGAVVVFAEDQEQVDKLLAERGRLPEVRRVIQIAGDLAGRGGDWVITLDALKELGRPHRDALPARRQSLGPDSILTIIYTSGTTGPPKGVVTTHANMLFEAQCMIEVDVIRPEDVQLLFLPLAHSFAKVIEIAWVATQHILAFAEGMDTIRDNLREARPTIMAGVPRVYEKFHAAIVQKGLAAGGIKARLFLRACELSEKNGAAQERGRALGLADTLAFAALKRLVFDKIGQRLGAILGGRMRLMVSGGAPLSTKIAYFFRDAGMTILEGYGLTETAAGAFINRPGKNRIGTVGQPFPGVEVRIAEDGEILLRGPNVMREYFKRPEETREILDDEGWLHTGDVGELDADGYLRITDRKKDIIVTAGGKNIAPQNLENLLKTHELISQAVVYGDRRKYLTALITLDPEALRRFAEREGLGDHAFAELARKPAVKRAVQSAIDGFNAKLPSFETIKRFEILGHDFTQESGELTPSLKVKRKVVYDRYAKILESMYDGT